MWWLWLILILGRLWGLSEALEKREFNSGRSEAQLWLACMVAPIGVWIRWYLARLNGRGLGKKGLLKWVPFGTLIANVSAACVMAALGILKKAVRFGIKLKNRKLEQNRLTRVIPVLKVFIAPHHLGLLKAAGNIPPGYMSSLC